MNFLLQGKWGCSSNMLARRPAAVGCRVLTEKARTEYRFPRFHCSFRWKNRFFYLFKMSALSAITRKKKRAAVTFLILSAVSEHLKAGLTRSCYVRQLNIRRQRKWGYHDLIQEMRLIVLHYTREFPLATNLQFFFIWNAAANGSRPPCKHIRTTASFALQEKIH